MIDEIMIYTYIIVGVIILLVSSFWLFEINQEEAVNKLGCEYKQTRDIDYCIFPDGKAYYVNVKCKGFFSVECKAQIINIGDVRIKEN